MVGLRQLVLENLCCVRGGRTLFAGVNLSLQQGAAALVTGPNGIGKSSLLRIVAGLLEAESGSVMRDGRIALVDEALALTLADPLADALRFWADLDGGSVEDALEALGIAHLAPVPVRMLSTGQRKRAALARVLASQADIWLLDEPGNGLDAAALDLLGSAIAAHRASGGIVLAASHQPLPLGDAVTIQLERPA